MIIFALIQSDDSFIQIFACLSLRPVFYVRDLGFRITHPSKEIFEKSEKQKQSA